MMSVLFDVGLQRLAVPREQARRLELALTLIQREGMRADAASAADAIALACAESSRPNIVVDDLRAHAILEALAGWRLSSPDQARLRELRDVLEAGLGAGSVTGSRAALIPTAD